MKFLKKKENKIAISKYVCLYVYEALIYTYPPVKRHVGEQICNINLTPQEYCSFTYEVDFNRHDVGKMLSVGGGEVEGTADHGQAAQVTLRGQDTRRLVQVETAVRVTGHDPVKRRRESVSKQRLQIRIKRFRMTDWI